jgi:predicted amidohydrolase YtcJ
MNQRQVDLVGTTSFSQIMDKLKAYNQKHQAEWIVGRGWDQNDWQVQEFPDRQKLDRVFPDKPVYLTRIDGHAALVNSVAMKKAGIDADTKVDGGKVEKEAGKPTGILIDNAMDLVSDIIPEPTREEKISVLQQGARNCFGVGLTSVADAGLGYDAITLMDSLQKAAQLKMQTYVMLSPTRQNYEQFMKKGPYQTPYMHIESIKLFADGALGSRGACMLEPYSDDPDNTGFLVTPKKEIKKHARKAYQHDYQVNTHAIGDSANRVVLEVYSDILGGKNDRRWRIEHAQVVHPDDFSLFGQYSIIPAVNTTHATSDMYWADERLGQERLKHAYAYKNLLKENGWLPNGSDFPVENINPLYGFYAAVARKDLEGYPEGGFQPENALTRRQALKAMTTWAARSMFEENIKGRIAKGMQADLVVAGSDIMDIPMEQVPEVKVLRTFVQGEEVFTRE